MTERDPIYRRGNITMSAHAKKRSINLGSFSSLDSASLAYQIAAKLHHGDFACPTN